MTGLVRAAISPLRALKVFVVRLVATLMEFTAMSPLTSQVAESRVILPSLSIAFQGMV